MKEVSGVSLSFCFQQGWMVVGTTDKGYILKRDTELTHWTMPADYEGAAWRPKS